VTVKPIASTIDIIPDMLHGSIDIASGQIPSFITAEAHGVGSFRLLASGLTLAPGVNEIVALKSSGITSGSQLKGKTIAENALVGDAALLVDSELAVYGTKPLSPADREQSSLTWDGFDQHKIWDANFVVRFWPLPNP